jgi:serine/threonine-protein kinase
MTVRGRYELHEVIGEGGMATVHLGMLSAPGGFRRIVAIKRLLPELARQKELARMLVDEAKLASRIAHGNVVSVLDVLEDDGETWLVMEHVAGETLARLTERATERRDSVPIPIAVAVVAGVLRGLHAAHDATAPSGALLALVHRDVSPQNILVGADGVPRLLDFGIARAAGRAQLTRPGYVRGKLAYMAPEQIRGDPLSRRSDLYAAAVVLWELVAGRPLFAADSPAAVEAAVLGGMVTPPSQTREGAPPCLDRVLLRALARDATLRFETATEMADALEACVTPARAADVAAWVGSLASDALEARAALIAKVEQREPESAAPVGSSAASRATASGATSPKSRPAGAILLAIAVILVAGGIGVFVERRKVVEGDHAAGATSESVKASPRASVESGSAAIESVPGPSGVPSSASNSSSSVTGLATPPQASERKPARFSASSRVAPAPSSSAPASGSSPGPARDPCSPPYVVDEAGHRIFKRECL